MNKKIWSQIFVFKTWRKSTIASADINLEEEKLLFRKRNWKNII